MKMQLDEIQARLASPIPSLRTPFLSDGSLDLDGVRSQIDHYILAKAQTLMLTFGDGLFSVLTDDEVAELTKVVVEHTAGRAVVIAADRVWATPKAVAFAAYCKEVGADVLMLMPPDWASSCSIDNVVTHFQKAGEHMPVMLVTAFFQQAGVLAARPQPFMLETARTLVEKVPSFVAFKDDILGDFGRQLCLMTQSTKVQVISGGLMRNHIAQLPYGVNGYLCALMPASLHADWNYWRAIEAVDYPTAWEVLNTVETPFWDMITKHGAGAGWAAAIHGVLEIQGICGRHRRAPYATLGAPAMEALGADLREFVKRIEGL